MATCLQNQLKSQIPHAVIPIDHKITEVKVLCDTAICANLRIGYTGTLYIPVWDLLCTGLHFELKCTLRINPGACILKSGLT